MRKEEILKKCRDIMYSTPINRPLPSDQFNFLVQDIFPLHPMWMVKKGGRSIRSVIVRRHQHYNNKCFALVLDDNSIVDISFVECINRPGLKNDIRCACQTAINDIYNPSGKPPIEKIISSWIDNFDLGEITVAKFLNYISSDNIQFKDLELINNFREYYKNNVVVRDSQ